MTKIAKIGFEIEGEFSKELMNNMKLFGNFTTDGSIRRCCYSIGLELAEFRSNPITFREGMILNSKNKIRKVFTQWDTFRFHFNESMGFHIHLSFTSPKAPEIWSIQFVNAFQKALQNKFPIEYKKRITNRFCKKYNSHRDIAESNDRYRWVSFKAAYDRHKTFEFRIFPANTFTAMLDYIEFTIDFVNNFLKKPIKEKITIYQNEISKSIFVQNCENLNNSFEISSPDLSQEKIYSLTIKNKDIQKYV